MTNILPGSHRAEYIISLQAYLCMDGKFLFEHQSSYQLFLTTKYYSYYFKLGEFNPQHCLQTQIQLTLDNIYLILQ